MAKLYWVMDDDNEDSCFIAANSARSACRFLEKIGDFDSQTCTAEEVLSISKEFLAECLARRGHEKFQSFELTDIEIQELGFICKIINSNVCYTLDDIIFERSSVYTLYAEHLQQKYLITRVSDFVDEIARNSKADMIFRGQRCASWELLSSLNRLCKKTGASPFEGEKLERYLISEFMRRSQQYIHRSPQNFWEWAVLAQHFGVPTRLLDWSENPLVALYFAVQRPDTDIEDAIVYGLSVDDVGILYSEEMNRVEKKFYLLRPSLIDARMAAQHSVLTIEPFGTQNIYDKNKQFSDDRINIEGLPAKSLIEWFVPAEARPGIKFELSRLGFNELSLFPGMETIGSQLSLESLRVVEGFRGKKDE